MTLSNIIAMLSLGLAFVVLLINSRKDTRVDAKQEARTEAKLDSITTGVSEIRLDLRGMRNELKDHSLHIAAVENSVKSAHHRLDEVEALVHKMHPPAGN